MITLTTLAWVPDFARGLVRDMRVRWALEEAGLPYRTRLIGSEDQAGSGHRARQPFGQVPTIEEEGLVLFESGAILLHIARKSPALLPADPEGEARATAWVFAALNSIEIMIEPVAQIDLFSPNEQWAKLHRPEAEATLVARLEDLAGWLGERQWLEDRFTCGDLMMASVLRILRHTDLVSRHPVLSSYLTRCTTRPAFQRALADHMAVFEGAEPG